MHTYAYPRFDERDDLFATFTAPRQDAPHTFESYPEPVLVMPTGEDLDDEGLVCISRKTDNRILYVQSIDFDFCQAESYEEATGTMLQEYGLVPLFDMHAEPIEQVGDVYELDTFQVR